MLSPRSVVVTGLGTVNALGIGCDAFWRRLAAGEAAAPYIGFFNPQNCRTQLGFEIREKLPSVGHPDRVLDLAISAAQEALAQAGGGLPPERTGVSLGTLQGGEQSLEKELLATPDPRLDAIYARYCLTSPARYLASHFGFHGPNTAPVVACAASAAAISRAADWIRLSRADAVVAGGVDSFCFIPFAGFNAMRALAPDICRPFSAGRQGLVIGEGAGILLLEAWEHARRRGAKPLAVVAGAGMAEDAYHITSPDPEARGAVRAMRAALADAGLEPEAISYVNAHGTGTIHNDRMESRALREVFGAHADRLPVSSIKAAVGHCMGAAGAVEAVASVLTLQHQLLPPTLNYLGLDPECDLDYVPNACRSAEVATVLSNSFGFGGNDVSLIFARFREEDACA